jgi:(p)ppGpp synthase/HD superfamily hydrolase
VKPWPRAPARRYGDRIPTTREPPFVDGRPLVREAVAWASEMHAAQRRDVDRAPFILHPLEVAALLSGRGVDEAVVAAGVLHDIVEDTDAGIEDVRARFGERIAAIVAAVTEDPGIAGYAARKSALRDQVAAAGADAHAVYAADKIAKARELRAQAARAESSLDDPALQQRLVHYERSLETLRAVAGELAMVDQLAFELWALRVLPPAG